MRTKQWDAGKGGGPWEDLSLFCERVQRMKTLESLGIKGDPDVGSMPTDFSGKTPNDFSGNGIRESDCLHAHDLSKMLLSALHWPM